jgi:hypothetical protein
MCKGSSCRDSASLAVSESSWRCIAALDTGRRLADLVTGRADDAQNPFSFRRLARLEGQAAEHRRLL